MTLYCGIDLHSNNHVVTIIDETDRRVFEERMPNDLAATSAALAPFRSKLAGVAVESTFNWYWLVDGLRDAGYEVKLVNTHAVRQYDGKKHTDDWHDAFWLAHLLRLNILPTAYIYPKEERAVRDLLRVRRKLVQLRSTHVVSVQSAVWRQTGIRLSTPVILGDRKEPWPTLNDAHVQQAVEAHRPIITQLNEQIEHIEATVLAKMRPRENYQALLRIKGIGPILAWTILLETGPISRFPDVGDYASYCRCVASKRMSNGKKKGENNAKCGNAHLSWAFVEVAHFAVRFEPAARRFYERKAKQRNRILAIKALAHKYARACYYMMRDGTPFSIERLFGAPTQT